MSKVGKSAIKGAAEALAYAKQDTKPLFDGFEWDFETLHKTWAVVDDIGKNVFGLDYFEPQFEVVSYEQMLDAYSSTGLPSLYSHWSFGKEFIQNHDKYTAGQMGLAYEMIINTDPTVAYIMENNSMTMKALVMAHSVCGHAHFFKNNYLFKEWTQPDFILDYVAFAKKYIAQCEEQYGNDAVEATLDAAHSLKYYGIDKYKRKGNLKQEELQRRKESWVKHFTDSISHSWDSEKLKKESKSIESILEALGKDRREFPEENFLYFLEKYSPTLQDWQREILRIVRKLSQYFYPQLQTKVMNEGFASFIHYHIMTQLQEERYITDGSYLEFLHSHTSVCCQPGYDKMAGFNPYALGFAMFMDIKRICQNPTDEDKFWFPDFAGEKDWMGVIKEAVEIYRDESFIQKFLSPKVIRDFKMFTVHDDEESLYYSIDHVHDDDDVQAVRDHLSHQYSIENMLPQLEITGVDWEDTRALHVLQKVYNGRILDRDTAVDTNRYLEYLWGYPIEWDMKEED